MNAYKFTDLSIGMAESFQHTVSYDDMDSFMKLTGDINPLHCNEDFALKHNFYGRVVYGMLSASLVSTLGGVYLPGKYCLIQQVEIKFAHPVYVGDILTVTGVVKELNESVQQAVIKVEIRNQNEKKVARGKLNVGFLE